MTSQRLDKALLARGLMPSRARAQDEIRAGHVRVNDAIANKPNMAVTQADIITFAGHNPYVSRAALKLRHALDHFDLTPHGIVADIGASTGGFTQLLLQRGAEQIYALDVGHGQLHPSLRTDPRIHNLEGINARSLPPETLPPLNWITADLSFISLTKALPAILALARPKATLVLLIKPQFELEPKEIGKGGIVRDAALHQAAIDRVQDFLQAQNWQIIGSTPSPIKGSDGNQEFLMAAWRDE